MTAPGGAAVAARTANRSKHLIAAAAVLLALWMGLAAPTVSPVSGPAVPAATSSVVQDQGRAVGGVAAVDDPDGDGGPRGRDGGRGR